MGPGQSGGKLGALMAGALRVWGLEAEVSLAVGAAGEAVLRRGGALTVEVRALAGDPAARWQVRVTGPERRRESRHAGVPGLLRAVRAALAPEQRPGRMIVAPPPARD